MIQPAGATVVSFGGAFNFAAMNNLGAELAKTPNLLFLNDDVEATAPDWVEMLNEQVSREDVGVAGGVLWYPSRVLQHAGIVAAISDGVGHVGRYAQSSELWRWLLTTRNVSAVTEPASPSAAISSGSLAASTLDFQITITTWTFVSGSGHAASRSFAFRFPV